MLLPEGPISLCPHISMSPYLCVPISPCPHISVSPYLCVPISPCPHISVSPHFRPPMSPLALVSPLPMCPTSSFTGTSVPPQPHISHSVFPPPPRPPLSPPTGFPHPPPPYNPPHSPPLSTQGFGVQGTEVALPSHGAGGVPAVPPTSVCPTSPTLNAPLPASPRFPVFNPLQPPPRWTQGLGWGGFGVQGVEVGVRVAVLTVLPSPAQRQCPHLPLHQRGGGLHPLPCGGGAA